MTASRDPHDTADELLDELAPEDFNPRSSDLHRKLDDATRRSPELAVEVDVLRALRKFGRKEDAALSNPEMARRLDAQLDQALGALERSATVGAPDRTAAPIRIEEDEGPTGPTVRLAQSSRRRSGSRGARWLERGGFTLTGLAAGLLLALAVEALAPSPPAAAPPVVEVFAQPPAVSGSEAARGDGDDRDDPSFEAAASAEGAGELSRARGIYLAVAERQPGSAASAWARLAAARVSLALDEPEAAQRILDGMSPEERRRVDSLADALAPGDGAPGSPSPR